MAFRIMHIADFLPQNEKFLPLEVSGVAVYPFSYIQQCVVSDCALGEQPLAH